MLRLSGKGGSGEESARVMFVRLVVPRLHRAMGNFFGCSGCPVRAARDASDTLAFIKSSSSSSEFRECERV